MNKTIRASVLILFLACSAQAGDMQNGSPQPPPQQAGWMGNGSPESSPPPPAPANTAQEPTTDGEMQNGVAAGVTEITLSLLAGLPSLF
jgi:hypothetical protein